MDPIVPEAAPELHGAGVLLSPYEQADLPRDPAVLTTLGRVHDVEFGLQASVVRGGLVRPGDEVRLLP